MASTAALLILATISAPPAAASDSICAERRFLSAFGDSADIRVQSPFERRWDDYAPPLVALRKQAEALRIHGPLYGDVSIVPFSVPQPPTLRRCHYYLVTPLGVGELRDPVVRAEAVVAWDSTDGDDIAFVTYRAYMTGTRDERIHDATGGVVIVSPDALTFAVLPSNDSLCEIIDPDRPCNSTAAEHDQQWARGVQLVAKYNMAVQPGGARYGFASWSLDHVCSDGSPNRYFKLVDADDLRNKLATGAADVEEVQEVQEVQPRDARP